MQITVAYRHRHQPAVYGPIPHQHPPIADRGQIAVNVPLHPARTTRLGTTPANPAAPPSGWPRTVRAGRRLASAIANASPPPGNATPVVVLLASPTSGLLTAVGPFTTITEATDWLEEAGRPGADITAAAFQIHTPPERLPWTGPDHRGRVGVAPGRHEEPAAAPDAAITASRPAAHDAPGGRHHQPADSHQAPVDDRALIDYKPAGERR